MTNCSGIEASSGAGIEFGWMERPLRRSVSRSGRPAEWYRARVDRHPGKRLRGRGLQLGIHPARGDRALRSGAVLDGRDAVLSDGDHRRAGRYGGRRCAIWRARRKACPNGRRWMAFTWRARIFRRTTGRAARIRGTGCARRISMSSTAGRMRRAGRVRLVTRGAGVAGSAAYIEAVTAAGSRGHDRPHERHGRADCRRGVRGRHDVDASGQWRAPGDAAASELHLGATGGGPAAASFIVDGMHLPVSFLKSALRAKGMERAVLVTDASSPAGGEAGPLPLGEQTGGPDARQSRGAGGTGQAGGVGAAHGSRG